MPGLGVMWQGYRIKMLTVAPPTPALRAIPPPRAVLCTDAEGGSWAASSPGWGKTSTHFEFDATALGNVDIPILVCYSLATISSLELSSNGNCSKV